MVVVSVDNPKLLVALLNEIEDKWLGAQTDMLSARNDRMISLVGRTYMICHPRGWKVREIIPMWEGE
jgi:hypothetical protein